jgi:hypothetical protein
MATRPSLALGAVLAVTLSVHIVGERRDGVAESVERTNAAPTLANPGGQADALTSEFGYAAAVLARNPIKP